MAGTVDLPSELLKHSSGKTNYMRLLTLINCAGTKIMRKMLNYHRIPNKLANEKAKRRLKRLKDDKNVLNCSEWKTLYPARRTHGKIESFDITLMFKLWRELYPGEPPRKGWDSLPDDNDLTLSADLARIKYYRNEFSHNNEDMAVSDEKFKAVSNCIKNALVRMLRTCNESDSAELEKAIDALLDGSKTEEDEVKWRQRIKHGGTQLKMFLKVDHYTRGERRLLLPFPSMEGERFLIKNLYTQVKITEKDSDESIKMENLFSSRPGSLPKCRRILIEGEPGIGKSSLSKKIAYDWSTKGPVFHACHQFELVLVLKCGKPHHEDIWSIIEEEILPRELCGQKEEIWTYIKEQQDKLLLIIDGFDEIPAAHDPKTRKAVLDIISGKMLPRCHLLVTSRTDKQPEIRKHFDKILNIQGFQWNDSCNFFWRFFSSSPDKARETTLRIRKDNELKKLVSNPLYATFTCLIFDENQQERLDLSSFFQEIVFCVTKRYCVEKQDQQVSDDALMDKFRGEHLLLGKLALKMIKENIDCFEERELSSSQCLKDLGFLSHKKEINRIRPKSCFYFPHSCIRKHFADFYTEENLQGMGWVGGWVG